MRSTGYLLLILSLSVSSFTLHGQTYSTGRENVKADVNFAEMADYYKAHPQPLFMKPLFDEDEEEELPTPAEPDPSQVHMLRRAARLVSGSGAPALLPVSPSPTDTFLSTVSDGTGIPPDTHGEVDSNYCVTAINTAVHIQHRNGTNVSQVTLDQFWTSVLPHGNGSFDPRVHYDPYYKRWIMVGDAYGQTTHSQIMIAVSATSNPTGTWHMYSVVCDPTGQSWLDFPDVGFNQKWIVVTGNFFQNVSGTGATGAVVYVFDYAAIMAGTGAPYTKISESGEFTLCPALTYNSSEQNMFLVDVNNGNTGKLRMFKITGPVATPVISSVGYPTSAQHWHNGGSTDFVPQLGTVNKIQAGDNRITHAVFRNNHIWCAHTVFLPYPGTADHCSVMWWEIDTLANPIQNGLIDDGTTPSFFDYPSIAVNQNDDALIGFGYLSANIHPSAAYALHMHSDPLDSMRPPFVFRHGKAAYYQTFGGSQDRWGDYSSTCVDPLNNINFWTIQESVPTSPANIWDTWWASISICPASASFVKSADTIGKNMNDTFTLAGTNPAGTTYTWTFGGGTATPGTGVGPQRVKWSTAGWHVVSLSVTDSGCTSVFTDSVFVTSNVGVANATLQPAAFEVMPNPNDGTFDIQFATNPGEPVDIKMADLQGRIVYKHHVENSTDRRIPVLTDHLAPGLYILTINISGIETSQKVTISH